MAFNPFSGTSADFYAVAGALTSGSDLFTPTGSETPVAIAEAAKYSFRQTTNMVKFTGFSGPTDATTKIIHSRTLAGGTASWSVTVEGAFSGDSALANSFTRFKRGTPLVFHLILEKDTGFGYRSCAGFVSDLNTDADVESQKPSTFSITISGDGSVPSPSLPS